jgi:hypothetical protein
MWYLLQEPPRPVKEGDKPAEPTPDSTVHLAFANDSGLKVQPRATAHALLWWGWALGSSAVAT